MVDNPNKALNDTLKNTMYNVDANSKYKSWCNPATISTIKKSKPKQFVISYG